MSVGYLINPWGFFDFFNLFYLFCFTGIVFIYALIAAKYKYALFFAAIWIVNYTSLASTSNIFLSTAFEGKKNVRLLFAPQKDFVKDFSSDELKASGMIILAQRFLAPYVEIGNGAPLTIVRVNFYNAKKTEYKKIFSHLRDFIIKQDNPVVIFGEFGIPSWNKEFKKFLRKADLTVKNRLLFNETNPFVISNFYVLGFSEMGISELITKIENNKKVIDIKLSFNPAQP